MPAIPGKLCLTLRTFVESWSRIMSFDSFWEPVSAFTGTTLQTAADDALTGIGNAVAPLLPDQVKITAVQAIFESDTVFIDRFSSNGPFPGTAAVIVLEDPGSRVLPDQDAVIIQRRTDLRGRENRGRMFIPGLWEDFNNEGKLSAVAAPLARDVATYFGADQTFGGVLCHARHWARKTNDIVPVTECRALYDLGSRRDRAPRAPHIPVPH